MKLHLVADAEETFAKDRWRSWWRRFGLVLATVVGLSYYISAGLMVLVPAAIWRMLKGGRWAWLYAGYVGAVVALAVTPVHPSPFIRHSKVYRSVALYFKTKVFSEVEPAKMAAHKKPVIFVNCPHGVITFGGWSVGSLFYARDCVTAAADVVLKMPFIKQLLGPFHLSGSSKEPLQAALRQGLDVAIYVGGIAEMFLSSRTEEKLYFKHRKGCIKIALANGADIGVCYIFGNTDMFDLLIGRYTAWLCRMMRMSICMFWGRWFLPVPYETSIVTVYSKYIELPDYSKNLDALTDAVVEEHHQRVMAELERVYMEYRHLHPRYKDKPLIFV